MKEESIMGNQFQWEEAADQPATAQENFAPIDWQSLVPGFPDGGKMMVASGEQTLASGDQTEPKGAVRNEQGQLTSYRMGPDGKESTVDVTYGTAAEPGISNLKIKRPDGSVVEYSRERSDPGDPNSPPVFMETVGGKPNDILVNDLEVRNDGRINLYLDYIRNKVWRTYDPKTGQEEF
jgi:hypothetical protein